jgi:hypothetical protein
MAVKFTNTPKFTPIGIFGLKICIPSGNPVNDLRVLAQVRLLPRGPLHVRGQGQETTPTGKRRLRLRLVRPVCRAPQIFATVGFQKRLTGKKLSESLDRTCICHSCNRWWHSTWYWIVFEYSYW